MFKITPVQDRALASEYAKICGISLKSESFLYAMIDVETENLMAVSEFEIFESFGYIYNITPIPGLDDFEALFILGRQTMNFIDLCGAGICRADLATTTESMLKALGFKPLGNLFECNMSGMFDGSHCSGHTKSN